MKKAMTINGLLEADKLGHILPHEHIIMEFPNWGYNRLYPELENKKVTMDILGKLKRDVWSCDDNLRLDEKDIMIEEILSFKKQGGSTIIDATTLGLGRDVKTVSEIAYKTGVNIIVGTGYYINSGHPKEVGEKSISQLESWMVEEVTKGIDGTKIRAGFIGEIGMSNPIHPDEEKVLRAALRAHRETGAPVSIHQFGEEVLRKIDSIILEEGVSPNKVILCHMGSHTLEMCIWAASKGYYVEIDSFGDELYSNALAGQITRDNDSIRLVKILINNGYLKQILISSDICVKILLKKYGGWGYEHIIKHIKPFMLREGISQKAIDSMIYYNPMEVIAYL